MNPDLKFTLDLAQLMMLAGMVWGLAKMSANLTTLRDVTNKLTMGLEKIGETLASVVARVSVLEDRRRRAGT